MSDPCYACIYCLSADHQPRAVLDMRELAQEFSPRFECPRDDLIVVDISGLGRLFGPTRAIGEELRRAAISRGLRVQVAVASTRTAAMIVALTRAGVRAIESGGEAAALASIPIEALTIMVASAECAVVFRSWGIRTLGELAALPSADLAARLGRQGLEWQSLARGQDVRSLVPELPEERFESSIELDWPVEGLEPLSFVLTRLLEPLSTRLERRDRGAAALHLTLDLVKQPASAPAYTRSLQLPSPIRDVRTLRTLILLDLEAHPPPAGVERVSVRIDPTPGRVWQHTLFTRPRPTPEQVSTLVARLNALMGADRLGRPMLVDSDRPGAFAMRPFVCTEASAEAWAPRRRPVLNMREDDGPSASASGGGAPREARHAGCVASSQSGAEPRLVAALRRCRQPIPARVALVDGRPMYVTTDRHGFAGGRVQTSAGPWRTSGEWWNTARDSSNRERSGDEAPRRRAVLDTSERDGARASGAGVEPRASQQWNRDEWDVALTDGAVYRIFRDRETESWFVHAIVD